MQKKRLVPLLVGFALAIQLVIAPGASHADFSDERFLPTPPDLTQGYIGTAFMDGRVLQNTSQILSMITPDNPDLWRTYLCSSLTSENCHLPGYRTVFFDLFSPCATNDDSDCIESLNATLPNGSTVIGKVVKIWNKGVTYKGDTKIGISDGGSTSSWELPGTNPGGSEIYGVKTGIYGNYFYDTGDFVNRTFSASIQPITMTTGTQYRNPLMTIVPRGNGGLSWGGSNWLGDEADCQLIEINACGLKESFPLDVKYSLKIRLANKIPAWMTGRLGDPEIKTESLGGDKTVVSISANAIKVPYVSGWIAWKDAPESIKKLYPAGTGGQSFKPDGFTTTDLSSRILDAENEAAGERAISEFKTWIPFLKDKPAAMRTLWVVKNISWNSTSSQQQQKCAGDNFSGLVTTNASVYSDGPPNFDKDSGSLNYTVGAPHFDKDGKVFQGSYNLLMKSDVARCLYGFSKAPISAKIEVASEDGQNSVAATVLNESNGWLRLSASGYHYSVPTLKVKLTQEAEKPVVAPTPNSSTAPIAVTKKLTISCVRGKVTKKVTAVKPVCPSGYKKK
jgi:hypothetical protein